MKFAGVPQIMWILYKKSFKRSLKETFHLDGKASGKTMRMAKKNYKKIISEIPEFEKKDPFKTNIVNCAMLISVIKNMKERPRVEEVTTFYEKAMTNNLTKVFSRITENTRFSKKTVESFKKSADLKCALRNEYSWNYDVIFYPDGSGYEARFTHCGICSLMKKYGYMDLVPAMCHLDYVMNEFGKKNEFVREYTLASGGPYCDCGYKKRGR